MLNKLIIAFGLAATLAWAQPPGYVALGDSLGEGVQSADASYRSQPYSYVNVIATQLGVNFPLPLIQDGPFTDVFSVTNRTRIDPTVESPNLAVSGADTTSILTQSATTPIANEADLVLSPRTGTQVQIAQSLQAPFMTCWIGSNDALSAVLAFDDLDASQLTPVSVFASNYQQIVQDLTGWHNNVVFANVPNVTDVGFLFNNDDLTLFLGQNYGLPAGSYTSLVAMLLLKLGIAGSSLLQDPSWVLDASEVQTIENAVQQYNQIIATDAAAVHMPVVNINALLGAVEQNGIAIGSLTLTTRYLGGMFSLDGVHPSDIGHAVIANYFIAAANAAFHMNTPPLTHSQLLTVLEQDPFVDFTGALKVRGRPFAGLLETLGPFLGISGDFSEGIMQPGVQPELGPKFMRAYFTATGRDPNTAWTMKDAVEAMREIFGLQKWAPRHSDPLHAE
jgi:lysophospholipase L1-like esterase